MPTMYDLLTWIIWKMLKIYGFFLILIEYRVLFCQPFCEIINFFCGILFFLVGLEFFLCRPDIRGGL